MVAAREDRFSPVPRGRVKVLGSALEGYLRCYLEIWRQYPATLYAEVKPEQTHDQNAKYLEGGLIGLQTKQKTWVDGEHMKRRVNGSEWNANDVTVLDFWRAVWSNIQSHHRQNQHRVVSTDESCLEYNQAIEG